MADHAKLTDRIVCHVEAESFLYNFKDVERRTKVSGRQVREIFREQGVRLLRAYKPVGPRAIGLDGVYFARMERAMPLDLERGVVYDMLPQAKAGPLYRKLLKLMTKEEREAVEVAVIDMSPSLRAVAKRAFPNATIVIDRFHVHNRVHKAMEKIRSALGGARGRKKGTRKMIRKEIPLRREYQLEKVREKKTERDRLANEKNRAELAELRWWRDLVPEFDEAYRLKEAFCEIWHSISPETALERYALWKEYLADSSPLVRQHFEKELVGTVDNWRDEIFAWCSHRYDNGAVERMNQEVKRLQREGRRLLFDAMRIKMIFGTVLRRRWVEEAEQHKSARKSRRAAAKKDGRATRSRRAGRVRRWSH